MEFLLNLAWVLMALPAYWLWRRGAGVRQEGRLSALQFLLALGCALVLLFPVISATDDLHAMRAEMEESATSKRAVRQAGSERHAVWVNRLQGAAALLASLAWLPARKSGWFEVSDSYRMFLARPCDGHAGRAPPVSFLG